MTFLVSVFFVMAYSFSGSLRVDRPASRCEWHYSQASNVALRGVLRLGEVLTPASV